MADPIPNPYEPSPLPTEPNASPQDDSGCLVVALLVFALPAGVVVGMLVMGYFWSAYERFWLGLILGLASGGGVIMAAMLLVYVTLRRGVR